MGGHANVFKAMNAGVHAARRRISAAGRTGDCNLFLT
jgi:hypothetical protein